MSAPSARSRLQGLLSIAAVLVFLALGLVLFGSGGNDDSHITYWPAWTLATRGEILSYNGAALEQSSSLTLVVLLGLLHALTGIALPSLGWFVSLAAGLGAVALVARRHPFASVSAGCALPLIYWSTTGMESSLAALLLVAIVGLGERFLAAPSPGMRLAIVPLLAGAAAVRPEMPALLLCTTGALAAVELLSRSERRRSALELVGWTAAVSALLVALRLVLFGAPVPNPALMKSGGFELARGGRYLLESVGGLGWLLPVAALAGLLLVLVDLGRRRELPASLVLAGAAALAGVAFAGISGGDWMPAGRFLVPVIPLLALLAAHAVQRLPLRAARAAALAALVCAGGWSTVQFARTGQNAGRPHLRLDETRAALEERWGELRFVTAELANRPHLRDAAVIPALLDVLEDLGPTADRPLVLMSGQAGMIPFHVFQPWFGRIRFLDLYGLTDDALVRCLPARHIRRSVLGAGPSEPWLWAHPEALDRCGIPRPDVIFSVNLRASKRKALREAGYVIVYEQKGPLRSAHSVFPGGGSSSAYVAVRKELKERVELPVASLEFPLEAT